MSRAARHPPSATGAYDPALDGLRAVAVVTIIAFHVSPPALPGGWVAVDLFFVLSGFLITGIVRREVARTGRLDLRRFYRRRTLRIWPAYFAMLAGVAVMTASFGTAATAGGAAQLSAATFTINWYRAFGGSADGALGHAWTLAVEQQFYLVWPLALLAVPRRWQLRATVAAAIVVAGWRCWLTAHGATMDRTYNGFDTHADSLLIGGALAMWDSGEASTPPRAGNAPAVAAMVLPTLAVDAHWPIVQAIGGTLAALASAALIACARRPGWLRDALHWPPLVTVGRLSFGLYLWHYPLLFVGRPRLPLALGGVVPVAATGVMAMLSWRYVEQPFLALKTRGRSARDRVRPVQP